MLRRLPIRWRLTAWYALILAVALSAFAVTLYLSLRVRLYDAFDEQLLSQAAVLEPAISASGGTVTMAPSAMPHADSDRLVRLLDRQGTAVADTSDEGMGAVPLDRTVFTRALAGQTQFSSQQVEAGQFRIVWLPIRSGPRVVGVLQVGQDRSDINESISTLLLLLAITAPLVLLVAVAGGYFLSRRALAPVATITDLAASIGGQDFGARLGLNLPDDELGRLARTFDAMLGRIEAALERQRRFTGDAAHELRTPLSLMRSRIDLALARPRSPADYRNALQELDDDLFRLTGLVATLLTLARAETNQLALEHDRFDLADTVELVLEQYGVAAPDAGVSLKNEASPCPIDGDGDRLIQVLVNLLDNALAHTPAGGVIAVGCRSDGDGVRLWVSDTGTGIAAEHVPRVFDRFYRADAGRGRPGGGAGLGLSITRAIVEAHGGTIALTSAVGRGTRIEITLPAVID